MSTVGITVISDIERSTQRSKAEQLKERVAWVDAAKGICILLVVLMHSTLGAEKALGEISWLHGFIEWARPFRMPDFFLISGLFLSMRIRKPIRQFMDGKVLHFVYFYALWMTILYVLKGAPEGGYSIANWAFHFIEPHGGIWFIYMLPVFILAIRLTRQIPAPMMFIFAAGLEMLPVETSWLAIDEFAARFVYVHAGYWLAQHIFTFADAVSRLTPKTICAGLLFWAALNSAAVWSGVSNLPGISLALGGLGAMAVITLGVRISQSQYGQALRFLGEHTLEIYLAFTLFMAATRIVLIKSGLHLDAGTIALLSATAGVIGPLVLHQVTQVLGLNFLFQRPQWARLKWH